nr:hypothetical protein OG781_38840 [Streptomyces sp. NBC_00830]
MRWDNLVENTREAGTGALFAAGAVTTRTFDTSRLHSNAHEEGKPVRQAQRRR